MTRPSDHPRDRDPAGRPRNARPRDALGRPLPRDHEGIGTTPDDVALAPNAALAEAQRLLSSGRPFHAHEVLENVWKAGPEAERELWRGLAQLAVGLTHARRGNAIGAVRLLRRAAERVAHQDGGSTHGVPMGELAAWAHALADRIERDGLTGLTLEADLTPRLLP